MDECIVQDKSWTPKYLIEITIMASLLIDHIDDHTFIQLNKMAGNSGESPTQLVRFLLAASLYHSHKMSFQAAAALSGLGFDGFKKRLREYFSTGYVIAAEVVEEDLHTAQQLSKYS